ncbi:MAG: glycosyltransferase family 39 protein [bacterium]|nr:glycosyltransferase family 39 protein [bacterium]
MAALVLLLVYLLLTLLALLYAEGLRRALLTAAVAFGLLLVVITELLSAVRLLSFGWLLNAWLMAALTMVVFIIHAWCRKHAAEIYDDEEHQSAVHTGLASIFRVDFRLAIEALPAFAILLRNAAAVIANRLRGLPRAWCLVLGAWLADVNSQIVSRRVVAADQGPRTKDLAKRLPAIVLLIGVLAVAVATGIIAFTAPPNNYDSMHSHTAKIPYWIQNHSIAQYSTHAVECIRYEPYAGFCILQFQVLSGGDQFANGVQWFSMLGCLIGVSLIAKCLGAQARGQIVAAVLCATLPMGIMQSTSTQVDYVTAFWLVCVVYHLLLLLANPSSWPLTLLLGTSFGLALLTKATNYFFAFPFAIWLAWFLIRHMKGRAILQMLVMAAIVLLVNAPHYARNIATFGHPLGLQTPSVVQKVTSIALGTWDATETSLRLDDAHYGSANMPLLVDDKAPVNQVSFKVTVDEAGLYDLSAVYATAVSCPFDLYINGYRERENVGSEITGGLFDQR